MSPELEKEITELVKSAKQAGSDAASFIAEQAPDVIQQLLAWEFVSSAAAAGVFVVLAVACALAGRALLKSSYDNEIPGAILVLVAVLALGASCLNAFTAAKVKLAPKLVVLEHIQRLR